MAADGTVPDRESMDSQEDGIERELPAEEGSGSIDEPFNPENIDVATRSMTIGLLLSRIEAGAIDLHPDFQRRWGIWDLKRQSRLIESLLLRIPLPTLYAAENSDEDWEIVDGIQRLSTIARFAQPGLIDESALILSGMEYLKDLNGQTFETLLPKLKRRILETELVVHVIRRGTPPLVKFNIFARINTGGVALSSQELRHALVPGPARSILERWANFHEFRTATCGSVKPARMDDRELVLRYIAFRLSPYLEYRSADMDGFLIDAMRHLNGLSEDRSAALEREFKDVMESARAIFGKDAFRKRYRPGEPRFPINKALFEALSVNLGILSSDERNRLVARRNLVGDGVMRLCNDRDFETAISQGTGDVRKVRVRFSMVADMLRDTLTNDDTADA